MPEISPNILSAEVVAEQPQKQVTAQVKPESAPHYDITMPERSVRDEFVSQHKKNGLFERFYNWTKNITNLGVGSKKAEAAVKKAENGEITEEQAKETIKKYRNSQAISAQIIGDAASIAVAVPTYFKLRSEAKMQSYILKLNEKFGSNDIFDQLARSSKGTWKEQAREMMTKFLAKAAGSKTKLAIVTAGITAIAAGFTKSVVGKINRIGSKEFYVDKKDFNNLETERDRAAYKYEKKLKRQIKRNANWKNIFSGAINGLMLPVTVLGNAFVGVPLYLFGNSLNRYFIGGKDEHSKSFKGYAENLKNDAVAHVALAAAITVPLIKKGKFAAVFDKNAEKAFNQLMKNENLIKNPYQGMTAYDELESILLNSKNVENIISNGDYSITEKIEKLTEENILAVKFKQIQSHGDELTRALQENCPPTRTLEEASKYIEDKIGPGYKIISNMGTGTIAETYLAEKDGKEVCIKILKRVKDKNGVLRDIDAAKIMEDKNKLIEIINGLDGKTDAEKKYLIRNVEDLAEGIYKEVDLKNERKAALELVKYTKTANVVKPKGEVINNVYVMEKAEGISFKKVLEINSLETNIKKYTKKVQEAKNAKDKELYQNILDYYKKAKEELSSKYKDIVINEKDIDYMIDEYMKVLVEQLYKTDNKGRVLHADIHPGNIFIDLKALKARKGKIFTLIDTGNTINLSAEQAEKSMKLTQYIERGNTTDIAKYFIADADLSASKFKGNPEAAEKEIKETLDKIFFDSQTRLNTVNNTEIINLTSNIMKSLDIMPGSSQLNLEKARTSAGKSFETLLEMLGNEAKTAINSHNSAGSRLATAVIKARKILGKYGEYQELQKAQEKKNLLSLIKNPKKFFESQKNPNNKARNSVAYLTYHMKQGISEPKEMF